jgi:hypothetical protein
MNKEAKQQYMQTLRERYLKGSKKEKTEILDEYCRNTGEERKYSIKKFRYKIKLKKKEERKPRKEYYDSVVRAVLAKIWEIFDYPCGQRLETILKEEVDRLRILKEISCSDETASKLKNISSASIDRKLEHEKHVLWQKRKYKKNQNPLLCQMVPIKTSDEMDRTKPGAIQIDCVEHCGSSASGNYVISLTTTDIFSGWWEGEGVMGKGQERALIGLENANERYPFPWLEVHPDNGGNILNYHVYAWTEIKGINYSHSRPYKKNDNCFIEQKNSTHVRKVVGYLRYDTEEEFNIINDLYRNELRLYKNFFQPTIKLIQKIRIKGKIHKKYDKAKTPYFRLMNSLHVKEEKKQELKAIYDSLNPAELKRKIDAKLWKLYKAHQKKKSLPVESSSITRKKLMPSMVSFYTAPSNQLRCHN